MSEAVVDPEIEDVLMSIRRLVQGETEPSPAPVERLNVGVASDAGTHAAAVPSQDNASDRIGEAERERAQDPHASDRAALDTPEELSSAALILTPSQRVAEDAARSDERAEPAGIEVEMFEAEAAQWSADAEDDCAEPAGLDALPQPRASDQSNEVAHVAEAPLSSGQDEHAVEAGQATAQPEERAEVPSFVREAVENRRKATERDHTAVAEPIAEPIEDLEEETASEPSANGAGRDAEPAEADEPAVFVRGAPRAGFRFGEVDSSDPGIQNLSDAGLPDDEARDADGAIFADQEPTEGAPLDQQGVDISPRLSFVSTEEDAQETALPEVGREALHKPEPTEPGLRSVPDAIEPDEAPTPGDNMFAPGLDAMDMEALTALISECVRNELQGELGERITRNVRKLVRREIHRAITMRDFE